MAENKDEFDDISREFDENGDKSLKDDIKEEEPGTAADKATSDEAPTTAKCDGDIFKYKPGKPIVSITFSLSSEQSFEVNVGTGITNYKRSEKKAFPVLCEVRDLTGGSDEVKITSLKNKACIAKNIPEVLAPVLTQLNALLLDQYTAYYETTKYDAFVTKQAEFSKAPTLNKKPEDEGKGDGEEKEKEVLIKVEGNIVKEPQQIARREKIEKLIQKLKLEYKGKDGTYEKYNEQDAKLNAFLRAISDNVSIDPLKEFLKNHTEVFPLYYLDKLEYGNKIVFMTNDGVLTDGEIILPYTGLDMENKTIIKNTFNWTFTKYSDYEEAVKILSGEVERIGYIDTSKINDEGIYKKGGKRKTLSKKLLKRVTKRNRK